jgi:hypothetical protein
MDLTGRVNKLERTVEDGFDRIMAMLRRQHSNQAQPLQPPGGARLASSQPVQTRYPTSGNETADEDEASQGGGLNAAGTFHASGATMAMKIDTILSDVGGKVGENAVLTMPMRKVEPGCLNTKMWEYGAGDNVSAPLLAALPSPDVCEALLAHFWQDLNWIRQPLPEGLVRPMIEEFLSSKGPNGEFPPILTTSSINVYACLALILAIASLSIEDDRFPREAAARRLAGRRLERAGQQALMLSQVLGRDDVVQIISFGLAWRFLMIDRRINEAWRCSASAIQSAYSIGLHRDGSKLGLPQVETDLRRGIWHSVRFGDVILAMNLGRPSISNLGNVFSDTQQPTLEGLDHWWKFERPTSHPNAKPGIPLPSIHQYMAHRNDLARIIGRIVEIYQKIEPHHYSDVTALDAEIAKLREGLPHYYKTNISPSGKVTFDSSLDEDFDFLVEHRFLMHMEINHTKINLHRSYLLRSGVKGPGGKRFAPSRRACVESAMQDLAMRDEFVESLRKKYGQGNIPLSYYIQIGSYSWFNSVLIASIAALLDPTGMPELPALREQIKRFLSTYEKRQTDARASELKDDMRDREASIIKMFSDAIDKVEQERGSGKEPGAPKKRRSIALEESRAAKRRLQTQNSGEHKQVDVDDIKGSSPTPASREEATADVLLDLGKPANNTKEPATSSPLPAGILSQISGDTPPHSSSSQHQTGFSSSLSTISGDSPSSRVVDDAQADLNAWFKREFAGGSLVDNSLTDLGLPDGSRPGAGGDSSILNSLIGSSVGGSDGLAATDNNPPYSDFTGASNQRSLSGQGNVQWATLPQPAWGTNSGGAWPSSMPGPSSTSVGAFGGVSGPPSYHGATAPPRQPGDLQPPFAVPNAQNSFAPSATGDGMGGPGTASARNPAASGGLPGEVLGGETSFDPGFWADLISKISK